jgi:hypothetical protein
MRALANGERARKLSSFRGKGSEMTKKYSILFLGVVGAFALASCGGRGGVPGGGGLGKLSLEWQIEAIGEGIKPALALDDEGAVHIAFLTEDEHGRVLYAQNGSGSFETTVVAEGYFYGPVDIAVDAGGVPYIAYHDHQALQFEQDLGDEVVAILRDGGWQLETVGDEGHDGWDNSIVTGPEGVWHTAAVDPQQFGSQSGVEYATNAKGSMAVTPVGSGAVKYEFGTSIQLGPEGSPGITYYNDRDGRLEYAHLADDGWVIEVVDDDGDAGRYSSLSYDAEGNPHISYFAALSGRSGWVRHAWREGEEWKTENVDALDDVRTGRVGARKITALEIGEDGVVYLAYSDRSRLVYAERGEEGWAAQEVVSAGQRPLGQLVELALDSRGDPHLIWFQPTSFSPVLSGRVMYASGS